MILTKDEVEFFKENGYLKVKASERGRELAIDAQFGAQFMVREAENNFYRFRQIRDDFLKINIGGVDQIFHPQICKYEVFDAIVESKLLAMAGQLLGTDKPVMALNRLHVTTNYSHTGPWHRDGRMNEEGSIQVALYITPEKGFLIIPGSHKGDKRMEGTDKTDYGHWTRKTLPGQLEMSAEPGDLLFFNSAIRHRGRCVGRRAHVYFNFMKETPPYNVPQKADRHTGTSFIKDLLRDNPDWKALLNDPARNCEYFTPCMPPIRRKFMDRLFATVFHYLLAFLPEDHWIFGKGPFWMVTPNLRMKKAVASSR